MSAADFWTSERIDKRIMRHKDPEKNEFAQLLDSMSQRLKDKGCTWPRVTRINFETHDMIWMEGWLVRPDEDSPFDVAALDPERRI